MWARGMGLFTLFSRPANIAGRGAIGCCLCCLYTYLLEILQKSLNNLIRLWNPKPTHFQACWDSLLSNQLPLLCCMSTPLLSAEETKNFKKGDSILRFNREHREDMIIDWNKWHQWRMLVDGVRPVLNSYQALFLFWSWWSPLWRQKFCPSEDQDAWCSQESSCLAVEVARTWLQECLCMVLWVLLVLMFSPLTPTYFSYRESIGQSRSAGPIERGVRLLSS